MQVQCTGDVQQGSLDVQLQEVVNISDIKPTAMCTYQNRYVCSDAVLLCWVLELAMSLVVVSEGRWSMVWWTEVVLKSLTLTSDSLGNLGS